MMTDLWRVELHCHTHFSPDSLTRPQAIVAACRRRGIDRIAITDHNTIAGALAVQQLAPELVIVGEEVMTLSGEIIAYFVSQEVPKGLPLTEAIAQLRAQNALISIPHPLDELRGGSALGLEATLAVIEQVDALEVFNARCLRAADNDAARRLAETHGKLLTAGSDAHAAVEIGAAVVVMPPFQDVASFAAGLARGQIVARRSPGWVRFHSLFARLARLLRRPPI